MSDAKQLKNAKSVFSTLCKALDSRNWKYNKDENELVITFGVSGDDLSMNFVVKIDADRELVRLFSRMPFKFPEERRLEGAIATCHANYLLVDGSLDYDYTDGECTFRMTASYRDSLLSPTLFDYMVDVSCQTVDDLNDKLLLVAKGVLTPDEFLKKLTG